MGWRTDRPGAKLSFIMALTGRSPRAQACSSRWIFALRHCSDRRRASQEQRIGHCSQTLVCRQHADAGRISRSKVAIVANSDSRFALVTAGHHFLLSALPLRHPESRDALVTFLEAAATCRVAAAELNAVLLECLAVLDRHTNGRLPSLIETYLARRDSGDVLTRFRQSVEDVLRYRGIADPVVQRVIALIEDHYGDSDLRHQSIAFRLGLRPAELSTRFKAQTGQSFGEYLHSVRLNRAANLLATTDMRIKEVWVRTGYNDPSNFDHDFKLRFGSTPRDYRAHIIRSAAVARYSGQSTLHPQPEPLLDAPAPVLIVDDDEGTREIVSRYLSSRGHAVTVAATGTAGLREAALAPPRAMLLDYHLPDMDGLQCLRELRRRDATRPRTVVLFTADWDVEQRRDEVYALKAIIASKLCEIEEIERVLMGTGQVTAGAEGC